ncbi:MAG TPA: restriction endonuclease subunit S [Pyrinomonadaceae bacterium]|nr:restriction endonuclease subunit S [Pyrinomonadaceae bacterium]
MDVHPPTETKSLPSSWSVQRLGKICKIRTGKKDVNEGSSSGEYPFFTCSKEIHCSNSYSFDTEAILVAGNGAVGETKYFRGKFEAYQRTYVLDHFSVFAPYLFLFLKGTLVTELARHITGSTMPYIRRSDLENVEVPIPPQLEQRGIAAALGLIQKAIEQQERLLVLMTQMKEALLHRLFSHGLRGEPQKQTEIGPMPESWNAMPLGDCCDIVSGSLSYTDFLQMDSVDDGNEIECMGVKVSDMNLPGNERKFSTANAVRRLSVAMAHRKLVPPDTVVFPKRGAAIATNKKRLTTAWTVLDPNLIGVCAKDSLESDFLFHWFHTFDLGRITDPGPTPQLNKKDLIPVLMPLPKRLDEQREIVEVISTVDRKLSLHQTKHDALTALFRTLLHQMMTAQIQVHDLELSELEIKK